MLRKHGPLAVSLSPVTVAELVHGVYRAKTLEAGRRRREYIEELAGLVPVHPATSRTGWLVGQMMIAAAAVEKGYAVLTGNNSRFFRSDFDLRHRRFMGWC
jgi:predicted nucleic acid-binding protein